MVAVVLGDRLGGGPNVVLLGDRRPAKEGLVRAAIPSLLLNPSLRPISKAEGQSLSLLAAFFSLPWGV